MKNRILSGIALVVLGLFISLGPQFLFKACRPAASHDGGGPVWMKCHWSVQAEIGVGALIAALGITLLAFRSKETRLGLSAAAFLSAVLALLIPHALIGGCPMATMPCQAVTFPAISVFSILVLIFSAGNVLYLGRRVKA
jgi:hypothetical protein